MMYGFYDVENAADRYEEEQEALREIWEEEAREERE